MKIAVSRTSNFPMYKPQSKDCIANRTRSATQAKAAFFDPKTNFIIATNFFKKVVGIDQSYPNLLDIKSKSIQVNIPTVEIWTGRLSLLVTVYTIAKQHGVI